MALPTRHRERPHAVGARVLQRVMGGPAWDRGRVLMPGRIPRPLSAKAAAVADMVCGHQRGFPSNDVVTVLPGTGLTHEATGIHHAVCRYGRAATQPYAGAAAC
jgi:hypothetical protein